MRSAKLPKKRENGRENPAFCISDFVSRTAGSPILRCKLLKVSGLDGKYSRFAETIAGD
jgi:hypothetical protein